MKAMTEKHNTLNVQIDKILNDANSELNILNQKLNSMIRDVMSIYSSDSTNRYANRPGQAQA